MVGQGFGPVAGAELWHRFFRVRFLRTNAFARKSSLRSCLVGLPQGERAIGHAARIVGCLNVKHTSRGLACHPQERIIL